MEPDRDPASAFVAEAMDLVRRAYRAGHTEGCAAAEAERARAGTVAEARTPRDAGAGAIEAGTGTAKPER